MTASWLAWMSGLVRVSSTRAWYATSSWMPKIIASMANRLPGWMSDSPANDGIVTWSRPLLIYWPVGGEMAAVVEGRTYRFKAIGSGAPGSNQLSE